jgi:hypothetical protein
VQARDVVHLAKPGGQREIVRVLCGLDLVGAIVDPGESAEVTCRACARARVGMTHWSRAR